MTTNQKGAIAEAAIVFQAIRQGVEVWRPVREGARCDLIFDLGSGFLRVQCKSAVRRGDVLVVPCHSSRRSKDGYVKRPYTREEIDAIAAYSPDLDRC